MAFLGFSAWVCCVERGNSKQKSPEKGEANKALRAVPAPGGAAWKRVCGSLGKWLCLGPQLSVSVPGEELGPSGPSCQGW